MCFRQCIRATKALSSSRIFRAFILAAISAIWLSAGLASMPAEADQPKSSVITTNTKVVSEPAKRGTELATLFNHDAPPLVPNEIEKSKLIMHAPQWSVQLLEFPSNKTIDAYSGKASPGAVSEAALWLDRILKQQYLPKDVSAHLLALKNYAVLYRDWIDHGGSDAFLVKYQADSIVFQILETPNYVLIACKDLSQRNAEPVSAHVNFALGMAKRVLENDLAARSADSVHLLEMPKDVSITTGYWKPNVDFEKLKAQHPGAYDEDILSDSIRFCTNGDVVAFEIFKYIWTASVENPFASRFGVIVDTRSDERLFTMLEDQMKSNPSLNSPKTRIEFLDRIKDRLVTRQAEEYLGPFLYDYEGNKITANIPFKNLDAAVSSLNDDQKAILVNQRMVDEYYLRGLKSFNEKDYQGAIANWIQVLELEPLNVRAAILLEIAMDFRKQQIAFAGEAVVRKDPSLESAREALATHKRNILKRRLIDKEEQLTSQEIASHQIKAIDYYTEGHFADAIREWDAVLKIDPANARALLFREMAIGQLKKPKQE